MDRATKVKLTVSTGSQLYYYHGFISGEENGFIIFEESKLGEIKLNKNSIISIIPEVA